MEQEAYLRPQLFEGEFKRILKNYPDSPFAARAAFTLLDNKLCGDWQGLPKCPEMETQLYLKYADRYPGGPKSAEALYNAAYRQGAVVGLERTRGYGFAVPHGQHARVALGGGDDHRRQFDSVARVAHAA